MKTPRIMFFLLSAGLACTETKPTADNVTDSGTDSSGSPQTTDSSGFDTGISTDSDTTTAPFDTDTEALKGSDDTETETVVDSMSDTTGTDSEIAPPDTATVEQSDTDSDETDGPDTDTTPSLCINGTCPDDDDLCNGRETCNSSDGTCVHVNPLVCDNGLICDGEESCDPLLGCLDAENIVCPAHQDCQESDGLCICMEGYIGEDCEACDVIKGYIERPDSTGRCIDDPCDPDPCSDHGTCSIADDDGFTCACDQEWSGSTCAFMWAQFGAPNYLYGLDIDDENRVFAASNAGLLVFDAKGTPFDTSDDQHIFFDLSDGLARTQTQAAAVDAAREGVWIGFGGLGGGAVFLDHGGTPFDRTDDHVVTFTTMDGLGSDAIDSIVIDPVSNDVWFLNSYPLTLSRLDDGGTPLEKSNDRWVTYTSDDGLPEDVPKIRINQNGDKWLIGYQSEALIYYLNDNGTPFEKEDDQWIGLESSDTDSSNTSVNLLVDRNGDKWISSYSEITYTNDGGTFAEPSDDVQVLFGNDNWLDDNSSGWNFAIDLAEDLVGGLWLLIDGGGLVYFDHNDTPTLEDDDTWTDYTLPAKNVAGLKVDTNNGKWVAASGGEGLLYLDDGATPSDTSDDKWQQFLFSDGPSNMSARIDAVDRVTGGKWLTSYTDIIYFDDNATPFDKHDDTWVNLISYEALFGASVDVNGLSVDNDNGKWLYTGSNGVLYLSDNNTPTLSADDDSTIFTIDDGLASNTVYSVAFDTDGGKWFGTNSGVSYLNDNGSPLDKSDDQWITFTTADGLNGDAISSIAISPEGAKWFGKPRASLIGGPSASIGYLDDKGTPLDKSDDVWAILGGGDSPGASWSLARVIVDGDGVWFDNTYFNTSDTIEDPLDDIRVSFPGNGTAVVPDASGMWWINGSQFIFLNPGKTLADKTDDTRHVVSVEEWFDDQGQTAYISNIVLERPGGVWISLRPGIAYVYKE